MVCHAGRYTTVSKSDDSKLQYGLVNVQPAPVVLVAADDAADVVEVEAVAVAVVADGFESYKSATLSASSLASLAPSGGTPLGDDDRNSLLDADADCGAAEDGAAGADAAAAAVD
jgi:hypothetical protein